MDEPPGATTTAGFTMHVNFTTAPSASVVEYDLLCGPTQGAYKMEIVARNNRTKAKPLCFFQGTGGKATLVAGPHLADGAWHTIECRMTSTAIQLAVDGAVLTKGLMDEVSVSIN
jgi:hypothetical protein